MLLKADRYISTLVVHEMQERNIVIHITIPAIINRTAPMELSLLEAFFPVSILPKEMQMKIIINKIQISIIVSFSLNEQPQIIPLEAYRNYRLNVLLYLYIF
jgi:hypothetical protein